MDTTSQSGFRDCALASGLVTAEQLDEAAAAIRAEDPSSKVDAKQLAARLVERGQLNSWQAQQILAGRRRFHLGPYRILDSIGQGGMGQVFKAEHTIMDRLVAVKVLPRHKSTDDAIDSFRREIRAQAKLDHYNLVRALDAGYDGNVYYLVTEYVPGIDLRKLVRACGKTNMWTAAAIIVQAAQGLAHAHSKGLIHRDIKPSNLLVTPEGHTKVSDLGLVGYFDGEEENDPRRGKIVGTADYLSPEQITTPMNITPATDIYSLGCTLYYAVTGKVPFPGGTTREKTRAHCHLQPLDPRRLNPELTDDFVDLIAAMMEKQVEARIQTAAEVAARLAPWAAKGVSPSLLAKAAQPEAPAIAQPVPPPLPPGMGPALSDTQPVFGFEADVKPDHSSSVSQGSIGTVPVASAGEDTQETLEADVKEPWDGELFGMPPLAWISIATALVAIAAIVISAIFVVF